MRALRRLVALVVAQAASALSDSVGHAHRVSSYLPFDLLGEFNYVPSRCRRRVTFFPGGFPALGATGAATSAAPSRFTASLLSQDPRSAPTCIAHQVLMDQLLSCYFEALRIVEIQKRHRRL